MNPTHKELLDYFKLQHNHWVYIQLPDPTTRRLMPHVMLWAGSAVIDWDIRAGVFTYTCERTRSLVVIPETEEFRASTGWLAEAIHQAAQRWSRNVQTRWGEPVTLPYGTHHPDPLDVEPPAWAVVDLKHLRHNYPLRCFLALCLLYSRVDHWEYDPNREVFACSNITDELWAQWDPYGQQAVFYTAEQEIVCTVETGRDWVELTGVRQVLEDHNITV